MAGFMSSSSPSPTINNGSKGPLGNILSICQSWQKLGNVKTYWSKKEGESSPAPPERQRCPDAENQSMIPKKSEEVNNTGLRGAELGTRDLVVVLEEAAEAEIDVKQENGALEVNLTNINLFDAKTKVVKDEEIVPNIQIQSITSLKREEAEVISEQSQAVEIDSEVSQMKEVKEIVPEARIQSATTKVDEVTQSSIPVKKIKKRVFQVDLEETKTAVVQSGEKDFKVPMTLSRVKIEKTVPAIQTLPIKASSLPEEDDDIMIIFETKRRRICRGRRLKYFPPRESYDCDVCCFLKFKTENERIQHLMRQANRPSWECESCSESFSRPMELHRHKIQIHQNRKRTIRTRFIELC